MVNYVPSYKRKQHFCSFKYIVLCNNLYSAGFYYKKDALEYIESMTKQYSIYGYVYTLFEVNSGDERELERIWISYEEYLQFEADRFEAEQDKKFIEEEYDYKDNYNYNYDYEEER